jgi:flagellar biosynthesis protein FlhB
VGEPKDMAVAVGYTTGMPAPVVLARGRGGLARAIARIAASCGISVVSDPDAARGLVEIDPGSFIPEEYYRVIAELLVFVGRAGSPSRSVRGEVTSAGEGASAL